MPSHGLQRLISLVGLHPVRAYIPVSSARNNVVCHRTGRMMRSVQRNAVSRIRDNEECDSEAASRSRSTACW
ncbi:hypothetical protein BC629DRAFT_1462928 [Irpex lacteus]|nr:hypothetical protein BC629DRAFT_1462928 [Irpex lacteus]